MLNGYKTKIGAFLLAIETILLQIESSPIWAELVFGAIGTFLTIYGFRDAMKT